jgi:hypothetical protein
MLSIPFLSPRLKLSSVNTPFQSFQFRGPKDRKIICLHLDLTAAMKILTIMKQYKVADVKIIDTGFGQKPYPGFGTKKAMLVQEGMTYDYLAFKRMICEAAGKFKFFLNLQVMCM